MTGWSVVTMASVATLVAVAAACVIVLLVSQRRTRRELVLTREVQEDLLARLALLERPEIVQAPVSTVEFVITDVGTPEPAAATDTAGEHGRIDGRLFADIVARETVVKAASWTHGLRQALSAENRNRLRFEMRRESKRSGRQRKSDVKEALRQYYARERGDLA